MFKLAVWFLIDVFEFGEMQGPWAGARMFEMLAAQDMGASF